MSSRNSSLLWVVLAILALSSAIEAFDITKMLGQYPELSSFSKYLTETKLADQINGRQTITVLAVDNSGISGISGKPTDTIKAILSTHVILDYYDEMKLMSTVENQKTQLTTLYQTTGPTNSQMGFIKVGLIGEGEIAFGSAVNGAPLDVELVKTVVTQPYNISILQVTKPIVAPGIDGKSSSPAPPSSSEASPSTSSQAPSQSPTAKVPAASRKQLSPSPEISPSSEASMAPAISPSPEEAESPLSDDSAPSDAPDDASDTPSDAPASNSPHQLQMGLVWAGLMGFGALLVAM